MDRARAFYERSLGLTQWLAADGSLSIKWAVAHSHFPSRKAQRRAHGDQLPGAGYCCQHRGAEERV